MKSSKARIFRKIACLPDLRFEDQKLTSFAGLVLFQPLFKRLQLRLKLARCFRHLNVHPIYGQGVIVMLLIVHLLLGYRQLRDLRYYQDDPLARDIHCTLFPKTR